MKGVTGFVSVLTRPGDERTRVFARYYHVRRVAWMTRYLASTRDGCGSTDQMDWYAWAHDLNRWPFAHNSERGLFDQAQDIPRYMQDEALCAPLDRLPQLQALIDKKPVQLGTEAGTALLADIITGFIEDPLWLLTTLNVSPEAIPAGVADYLCMPLGSHDYLRTLFALFRSFRPEVDAISFIERFDSLFVEVAQSFVPSRIWVRRSLDATGVLFSEDFKKKREWIKERFMRRLVFPYNNEKISRGSIIKDRLVLPLLPHLGPHASRHLTRATDKSLLDEAIARSILQDADRASIMPDLDYMDREESSRSFTAFMEVRHDAS